MAGGRAKVARTFDALVNNKILLNNTIKHITVSYESKKAGVAGTKYVALEQSDFSVFSQAASCCIEEAEDNHYSQASQMMFRFRYFLYEVVPPLKYHNPTVTFSVNRDKDGTAITVQQGKHKLICSPTLLIFLIVDACVLSVRICCCFVEQDEQR
jgi:hypothetical protein